MDFKAGDKEGFVRFAEPEMAAVGVRAHTHTHTNACTCTCTQTLTHTDITTYAPANILIYAYTHFACARTHAPRQL